MDIWIKFLIGMLIANKYTTWSCNLWPLNLTGTMPLCLGGMLIIDLTSALLCRSSLSLVYVRKELPFVYRDVCHNPNNRKRNIIFLGLCQKGNLHLVVYHIWQKCAKNWNLLSGGKELLFLWKTWVTYMLSDGSMLQAVYWSYKSSVMLYTLVCINEMVAPDSMKVLKHFPACTFTVGQSEISPIRNRSYCILVRLWLPSSFNQIFITTWRGS